MTGPKTGGQVTGSGASRFGPISFGHMSLLVRSVAISVASTKIRGASLVFIRA
jgi:hypothetical protein